MHYTQSRLFLSKLKLCPQSLKIIGVGVGQLGVRSAIGFATHGIWLFEFKPNEMVVLYVMFHVHDQIDHITRSILLRAVSMVKRMMRMVLVDRSVSESCNVARD